MGSHKAARAASAASPARRQRRRSPLTPPQENPWTMAKLKRLYRAMQVQLRAEKGKPLPSPLPDLPRGAYNPEVDNMPAEAARAARARPQRQARYQNDSDARAPSALPYTEYKDKLRLSDHIGYLDHTLFGGALEMGAGMRSGNHGAVVAVRRDLLVSCLQGVSAHPGAFNRTYSHYVNRGPAAPSRPALSSASAAAGEPPSPPPPPPLLIADAAQLPAAVVVKVQVLRHRRARLVAIKEDRILRDINDADESRLVQPADLRPFPGACNPLAGGLRQFPEFLFGATVALSVGPRLQHPVMLRVTFMSMLPAAEPLDAYMRYYRGKDNQFDSHFVWQVALLERAVLSMWLAGYYHADLHTNNVLMVRQAVTVPSTRDGRPVVVCDHVPYLIDLGMAVRLTPQQVEDIRHVVLPSFLTDVTYSRLADVFKLSSAKMRRLGYSEYNSDYTMLRELVSLVPKAQLLQARRGLCASAVDVPAAAVVA